MLFLFCSVSHRASNSRFRFLKDGEPGRKVTCQECHKHKYGDAPPSSEAAERADRDLLERTRKKNKKAMPKFAPELLLDRDKGLSAIFKSFPKLKFRGKGHEASDLQRLLSKYAEWANVLVPDMEFSEFVTKVRPLRFLMRPSLLARVLCLWHP